jgi:hypothetical protein
MMMKIGFKDKIFYLGIIATFILFVSFSCKSDDDPSSNGKDTKTEKIKVGAWYFGGWSMPADSKGYTFHISPTLVTQYSYREPIWGWREDKLDIMVDQINYAADNGLSFWGFCWYENSLSSDSATMNYLNTALKLFLQAPNRNRLNFCLLSCQPVSQKMWSNFCLKTIAYFKESNYLKVGGKPVMIFFNTDEVIKGLGGTSKAKEAFDAYRALAKAKGIGDILIGARTSANVSYQDIYKDDGFDFLTTYQNSDDGRNNAGANDYSNETKADCKVWDAISSNTSMKYIPTMGTGYDMRPWAADHPTLPASDYWYTSVTPEKIAAHLKETMLWARNNKSKVLDNMVLIYAWNENGEGGWLTPTKSENSARLDAVKKVINEINN